MQQPMRVLVVDDHPLMRAGISAIVNAQPDMTIAGEAGTSEEAITLFERIRPDVTLMDLQLPPKGGVSVIRELRSKYQTARFLVVTTYEGDEDIFQALQAGAIGYLIKGLSSELLLKGLRHVHAGRRYIPSEVAQRLQRRNPQSMMSEREQQVLRLLARGKSNRAIAAVLGVREATVKAHMTRILENLNAQDRTEAVIIAHQRGLIHL
jgi:DNA-binding NarL/FixJ family response regulator